MFIKKIWYYIIKKITNFIYIFKGDYRFNSYKYDENIDLYFLKLFQKFNFEDISFEEEKADYRHYPVIIIKFKNIFRIRLINYLRYGEEFMPNSRFFRGGIYKTINNSCQKLYEWENAQPSKPLILKILKLQKLITQKKISIDIEDINNSNEVKK